MFLIFDTETTGLPGSWNAPITDSNNWPRCVQLAWQLHDFSGKLVNRGNYIIQPEGYSIPFNAEKVHGISTERAMREGHSLQSVLEIFQEDLNKAEYIAGHNIEFDINIMGAEYYRKGFGELVLKTKKSLDTKDLATEFCAIPGGKGGKFKWPTLTELHVKLFGVAFEEAHDAAFDVDATSKCFFGLIQKRVIAVKEVSDPSSVIYEAPILEDSNFKTPIASSPSPTPTPTPTPSPDSHSHSHSHSVSFVHLHVHSQYSVLQSTIEISAMVKKAKACGWPAIAITDHGNMMGAFQFVSEALKSEIKPIVGCELNICRDLKDKTNKDDGFQTVILAKNKDGYHNLAKLSSIAFTEGFYYVPRIDKETLLQYKENLIVTTGGMYGEIPYTILNFGEEKAEELFVWWKEQFGEDFYAEINRHGLEEEDFVNRVLIRFCQKYGVKYFAANSSYYNERSEAEAQDALVCVKEGEYVSKPSKYIGKRGREFRFGLPNDQFYIKTTEEMSELFADMPVALAVTMEIADKCESYKLAREVLLPKFEIPEEFQDPKDAEDRGKRGENAYLRYLTYEGAKRRYKEVTLEITERIDFELKTIENSGYPGYFLIVQDFCAKAREMGVSVGPGRGSAAGSAVAYCIGITNVDPIKYNLLFERFLNPERVSLPDIDIDFDDEGRDKVIDYVRKKYGNNMVAQIITYGTMAAKSSIRDAGRVFELPLPDTDRIAKLMPDGDLAKILKYDDKELASKLNGDDLLNAKQLREIYKSTTNEGKVLQMAGILEGSVRNTGIHACGVIITPDDITKFVPVATAKDSDMWCTQFDNSVVESAGLLKMDFLGLKTLTLIKHTIRMVRETKGIDIDIDAIPLDDEKTYQLFQRGETVAIFQYESDGMRKYLRDLKPTVFDDLIAMNALYRPGPLEYIPSFIKRKHGTEAITYDLPDMEEYLKETYGITVYQEQVMLLSQKLAGFSKGEADVLRKAMGKKQKDVLDKMKGKFMDGAAANGHPADKLEKIWTDWEAFASYAFNKSHSTCYAWVAYQTAYLKAHYPAEYMASVLSNNLSDIKQVTFFMQECKLQNIPVLGPDVNESNAMFTVNQKGEIRFGLAAVKGVGENAVESIVKERKIRPYKNIFDFMERIDAKAGNKKVLESLALAGALDEFKIQRASYFAPDGKSETFIETLLKYANSIRESKNTSQVSLFGDMAEAAMPEPQPPVVEPWDTLSQLSKEKEVVGMFISGHPMDDFELEIRSFCSEGGLTLLQDMEQNKNRELKLAGMVTEVIEKVARASNKPFGTFKMEDYEGSFEFVLFGEDYMKYRHLLQKGHFLFIAGRVQTKKFGPDADKGLEFKINRVEPLYEIREKMARYLTITVPLEFVSTTMIDNLTSLIQSGQGKTQMRFKIRDGNTELVLPSLSHNKVAVSNDLVKELKKYPELEYMVESA
ncbi:MAG: DNA polymerase III subunit alpha [Flavobacteriales bacterium]|jgi:DNA polymerase-3 subunit alpha